MYKKIQNRENNNSRGNNRVGDIEGKDPLMWAIRLLE